MPSLILIFPAIQWVKKGRHWLHLQLRKLSQGNKVVQEYMAYVLRVEPKPLCSFHGT